MNDNLIILAGGASSRMKKHTMSSNLSNEEINQANSRSKGLISVDNDGRPLMDYLLHNAKRAGYNNIYIVIGEQSKGMFKSQYGQKDSFNLYNDLNISFAIQYIPKDRQKPFGTADALYQAMEQYPKLKMQNFTVCNSDNLYSFEVLKALANTKSKNAFISYTRNDLKFSAERIAQFALVKLDANNFLVDIIEKPKPEEIENYRDSSGKLRVSMNIFKFNGELFFDYLENCPISLSRNEKELPTALLNMTNDHPNSVIGIPFSEHVPDLTAKEDIQVMKAFLKENYANFKWEQTVN